MKTIRLVPVVLAFAACGAVAQGKACGAADSAAAETALDRVVNWELMFKAWKDYQHCDRPPAEDFFTDALMRLAVEWKHVEQFASHYRNDPQFKAFVHKHMKSATAKEDVQSLYSRAKQSCPPKLEEFCAELAEAAKPAL